MAVVWKKLAYEDDCVLKTLFDAYSILAADTDNVPAALVVAASTIVGRKASGGIVALSKSEAQAVLNVADGATANAKATGAELDTGTDDDKFATAKALKDSHNVPSVVPSTAGKVLTSDGTDWVSSVPAAPSAHNILSTSHGDTLADSVLDGDVLIGNVTPKWSRLAISVPGAGLINHLAIANGETRPSWKALFDATVPTTMAPSDAAAAGSAVVAARRDHVHGAPATWPPSAHALSGHTAAVANLALAGYQITDQVVHTVADEAARLALTPVVGKFCFQTDVLAPYICTVLA